MKSCLILDSTGCYDKLCCWFLSLFLILQYKVLSCPILPEETKQFSTPSSSTMDALMDDEQRSTTHGMPRICSKGQHTDPRDTHFIPNPEDQPPLGSSRWIPWGQDIPLWLPFPTRHGDQHGMAPAGSQHHEQPSAHCLPPPSPC